MQCSRMLPSARLTLQQSSRFVIIGSPSLPDFLVPAFAVPSRSRTFTTNSKLQSRVGAGVLSIPSDVSIRLSDGRRALKNARPDDPFTLEVEGPLGKLSLEMPYYMKLDQDIESRKATLSIDDRKQRKQREMWGTTRSYLHNHLLGVSEGHVAILRLVGVGYRASVENPTPEFPVEFAGQKILSLKVGFPHSIDLGVPFGVKASTPQPTRVLLEGIDKEAVLQFAAKIRRYRVPEPYKGKGVFVNNETIKLKSKKIK